jgi:hypothetical protein
MENTERKKFYSVNLVAFIYSVTRELPEAVKDDEGLIYFIYETSQTIDLLVDVYKRTNVQVDLHKFLSAFRDIRNLMAKLK